MTFPVFALDHMVSEVMAQVCSSECCCFFACSRLSVVVKHGADGRLLYVIVVSCVVVECGCCFDIGFDV